MTAKSSEKIIEALTMLLEGFSELQTKVQEEYEAEDDDDDSEAQEEMEAALVAEIKHSMELVMETDDYSTQEVATLVSALTESLEEIDPDIFEGAEDDEAEGAVEEIEDIDDDDLDDDDEHEEYSEDEDDDDDS